MEELRKCPFCGGEATMAGRVCAYWIDCTKCHGESGLYSTVEDAIAAWNRRVTQNIGKKECCEQGEEQ